MVELYMFSNGGVVGADIDLCGADMGASRAF